MPASSSDLLGVRLMFVVARHLYNDAPVNAGELELSWSHDIWDLTYFRVDAVSKALAWGRCCDGTRVDVARAFPDGLTAKLR